MQRLHISFENVPKAKNRFTQFGEKVKIVRKRYLDNNVIIPHTYDDVEDILGAIKLMVWLDQFHPSKVLDLYSDIPISNYHYRLGYNRNISYHYDVDGINASNIAPDAPNTIFVGDNRCVMNHLPTYTLRTPNSTNALQLALEYCRESHPRWYSIYEYKYNYITE